jgi:hypothetical protein
MEPKRFNAVIRHGEIVPEWTPTGALLSADDPAIIEALQIARAARDAGLVVDGKLREPDCYWDEEGNAQSEPCDDMSNWADCGSVAEYRPAWGGRREWWLCDDNDKIVGPFKTYDEADKARSAAEAAKGGGDA